MRVQPPCYEQRPPLAATEMNTGTARPNRTRQMAPELYGRALGRPRVGFVRALPARVCHCPGPGWAGSAALDDHCAADSLRVLFGCCSGLAVPQEPRARSSPEQCVQELFLTLFEQLLWIGRANDSTGSHGTPLVRFLTELQPRSRRDSLCRTTIMQ